jgi:uncharacterized integral membrane protein
VSSEQPGDEASVTDRVEDVARAAAVLAARGGELAAVQHRDDVRRVARTGLGVGLVAVALLAAFALANVAAVQALWPSLESWRAPLLLAAVWLVVALAGVLAIARWEPWLRRLLRRDDIGQAEQLAQRQAAFDAAQSELHEALQALTAATAAAAQREIAEAIVPDSIADVGEGLADAGDRALDMVDGVTDTIEERIPGGVVVNRAFDIALTPGRIGVRAARSVFSLGGSSSDQDDSRENA